MPPLTILSDTDVQAILHSLTPTDANSLATTLEDAFIQSSCHGDASYQPHRSVLTRPIAAENQGSTNSTSTGSSGSTATSIFMPATTPREMGVKIIGIAQPPSSQQQQQQQNVPKPGLKSILTLCTAMGQPTGVLNAAELTGFRTALGTMLLYRLRKETSKIVVFGAGKQAEWHIRLAVLFRGADIKHITIVNGNKDRAKSLVDKLSTQESWPKEITLDLFSPKTGDGGEAAGLEDLVVDADVLFFTTPSKIALFPARYLFTDRARQKTRYFGAIGSYTLEMGEIDPELITAIGQTDSSAPFAGQVWDGHIVVDSREACLHEAGEFVKSELSPEKWLDVGQVTERLRKGDESDMRKWLETGFVVYKSVGVGVMDISIGSALLGLAHERGVGTTVADF